MLAKFQRRYSTNEDPSMHWLCRLYVERLGECRTGYILGASLLWGE